MALVKKFLVERVSSLSRISNPSFTNCRTSSPSSAIRFAYFNGPSAVKRAPDRGVDGLFRRFLHRQCEATAPSGMGFVPAGEVLLEKLRGMDIARERVRLDGLRPPVAPIESAEGEVTVADARKILRLSQLEQVKATLREIGKDCISYPEYLEICAKDCWSVDQATEIAKMLDESGTVVVLGNIVFLRPEQVVKALQGLMLAPVSPDPCDPRMEELKELEKLKATIDSKAVTSAKRELWCGLAYLVVQTAAFMRLTFWELSWDVMEPICFYVTSIYFMGAYVFFLRTSKEPSFEGFLKSRLSAKQKRIMKANRFDLGRYNDLKKACYPHSQGS